MNPARLLLAAWVFMAGTAFGAGPQLLLPGPAVAAAGPPDSAQSRGKPMRFNAAQMFALAPRAEVELTLPDGSRHPYVFEFAESRTPGITTWVGRHRDRGVAHRAIVTQGPHGAFGVFSTPEGEYGLIPGAGTDVLVDLELESAQQPPIDLRDDALPAPAGAKLAAALGQPPAPFVPREGINYGPIAKTLPTPIYEIDLMIVYSPGFATTLGNNLLTRLDFLVARANTTLADSEVAARFRLVRSALVDYPDSRTTLQAISDITPICSGATCTAPAHPAFRDVETMRARVGADMVAFLRGTNGFSGDGRAYLGGNPPYHGSMYSVTTGCVLGCEWVFIHELGHNLGVHHDRGTVAQQAGGTSTYYGGAFPYSFGYAYCVSGSLSCNPEIPPSSGGCGSPPECSTYDAGNFSDVMAYFYGSAFRNYRYSNPLISCVGSNGVPGPCGIPQEQPKSADGALSINNLRDQLAAIKSTVDPLPPPPALLSFDANASMQSAAGTDMLFTVNRANGSSGNAQATYRTRDGSARAGTHYAAATGQLAWADGDTAPKVIRVPTLAHAIPEAGEYFYVDLSDATGSSEVYLTPPSSALGVLNASRWPAGDAPPTGFTPGGLSSADWTLASDQAYEGGFSLKSGRVFGTSSAYRSSQVVFSGQFADGEVVFAYRVSAMAAPRAALQFSLDGNVVLDAGGETGWRVFHAPVAAGYHSLFWTFLNYETTPCSGIAGAPGGTSCADAAWIDAVMLPLASTSASLAFTSSPNPSVVGGDVTLTAQLSGARGTPTGTVSFRDGVDTIPQCSAVTIEAGGRAVCVTAVLTQGTHSLAAVYSGDSNYAAGTNASLTQTVNAAARAAQTITFVAPADRAVDSGDFVAQATASSGLPVSFSSQTGTVCVVSGSTVKLRGIGTCTLVASQAGNASYEPAAPVTRSFAVSGPTGNAADTRAVPTYEAVGLYWSDPGADPVAGCDVRFRRVGDTAWTPGLALWLDTAGNECRGSLVNLAAGTDYEAELGIAGRMPLRRIAFRTWANRKPVAMTLTVPGGSATLDVTQGGSPAGYVVYQAAPGAVLDAANAAPFNVTINASYVIVRGFALRGAQQDAIRISPGVSDVIIEDNDIAGWGRGRGGGLGVDMDSAIRAICAQPTLERVTIQRNTIHEPRFGANSWSDGHPLGPQAITFSHCGGNHVIRHNEITSTAGHYYNDIVSGEDNFSTAGFPNYDSDVYGNVLSHAWDDAIEAEGGNRNVRVWGNYIDSTTTGIATALTSVGPFYAFRNVYNRNRELEKATLDSDLRQELFKAGSDPAFADGRRYFFHNTTLQARTAGATLPLGVAFGISGSGATQPFNNAVSRNNIYHTWNDSEVVHRQPGVNNEFTRDMYNGVANVTITDGIHAAPVYAPGNGWESESGGQYALAAGTPGHDAGVRIANFNDAFVGAAPDVGAAEAGAPAMVFGIAASPGPSVVVEPPPPPPPPPPASTLSNLSTRGQVLRGNDVMIGGFVIGGSASKTVVVRARGPSLIPYGITNALANPMFQIFRSSDQAMIAANDDWGSAANAADLSASGFAPSDAAEAALLVSLPPGAYTAVVSGVGGTTGVGIVEVFEVDHPEVPLVNISTRGQVLTGNDVMIGGFVIQGSSPQTVVVRARGPSLAPFGITNALMNPTMRLVRSSDQSQVAANDDWGSASNAATLAASGFAPSDSRESALLVTLPPGAYTAIVSGVGGSTGVGIVEVFAQ